MTSRLLPRCLRREEAAAYVGVSPSTFDNLIRDGHMPKGFTYPGRVVRVWDTRQLDIYIDLQLDEAGKELVKL